MFDELKSMAIFSETADQGSFRKAAETLGLSPSVVSYHVSQLEERLGATLFYRTTRKLSLTHEGETLHQYAKDMMSAATAGMNEIAFNRANPVGKLKISLPQFLIRSPLIEKLASYKRAFKKVSLDVSCTDERDDIIQEGIDLAIRAGSLADSNFKSRRIFTVARKLVCSPDYLAGRARPVEPKDLQSWDWISLKMLPLKRELSCQSRTEVIAYKSTTSVNSVELLAEFALHGLGVSTPPDFLVEDYLASGELVEILPEWTVSGIDIHAVWPEHVQKNSNVMEFLNHLKTSE